MGNLLRDSMFRQTRETDRRRWLATSEPDTALTRPARLARGAETLARMGAGTARWRVASAVSRRGLRDEPDLSDARKPLQSLAHQPERPDLAIRAFIVYQRVGFSRSRSLEVAGVGFEPTTSGL